MSTTHIIAGAGLALFAGVAFANGEAAEPTPTPIKPIEDFSKVYWKNDLRFETADKQFVTRIGGRLHFDGIYTDDDDQSTDGWIFRRARLYVSGTVYGNVHYKAQYDFAGGAPAWKDVYMKIDDIVGPFYLQAGQFWMPFGFDVQTSSNNMIIAEYSITSGLAPERQTGLAVGGDAMDESLFWKVALFNANSGAANPNGNAVGGDYQACGRVVYKNDLDEEGSWLQFGGSISLGAVDDIRFRVRPDVGLGNRLADTGTIAATEVMRYGAEVATVLGPLSAQAEYIATDIDAVAGSDPGPSSYYLQVAYLLTGESHSYDKGNNSLGGVTPNSPWQGWGNGTGAFELAARYSSFDTDLPVSGAMGGELTVLTLGANWYLNSNMRLMLNYAMGDNSDTDVDQDSYIARFQVTF
ncbi:MAG: porin [Planctomycetota bacterium]